MLYPEGSPVISVAMVSEAGKDALGLAVLFQLPWQWCHGYQGHGRSSDCTGARVDV